MSGQKLKMSMNDILAEMKWKRIFSPTHFIDDNAETDDDDDDAVELKSYLFRILFILMRIQSIFSFSVPHAALFFHNIIIYLSCISSFKINFTTTTTLLCEACGQTIFPSFDVSTFLILNIFRMRKTLKNSFAFVQWKKFIFS